MKSTVLDYLAELGGIELERFGIQSSTSREADSALASAAIPADLAPADDFSRLISA